MTILRREIIPIVRHYQAEQPSLDQLLKKKGEKVPDGVDGIRWLCEKVQNKRHPSGRINFDGQDRSDGAAHTVCPYVPHFLNNVEDGVKPLVSALFSKGYLTYSSCEGHIYEVRYVGLAFPSIEARTEFMERVRRELGWKKAFVKFVAVESVTNAAVQFNEDRTFSRINRGTAAQALTEGEILYFNTLYYRRYDFWCFLRLQIGYEIVWRDTDNIFNNFWLRWKYRLLIAYMRVIKKLFVSHVTELLAKTVRSDSFPPFLY
jgi:hypothetical protein